MPGKDDNLQQESPPTAALDSKGVDRPQQTRQTPNAQPDADALDQKPGRPTARFPAEAKLIFAVENSTTQLTRSLTTPIMLGRAAPKPQETVVDLSDVGAVEHGVSRRHAVLERSPNGYLVIKDLGSTNGTFINGQRLQPHQDYLLAHGDRLQLGGLVLGVSFEPAPKQIGERRKLLALIVEDDLMLAASVDAILQSSNHNIATEVVTDGQRALDKLTELTPDIVILDMRLPHVSGLDILKHIRKTPHLKNIKVAVTTAEAQMAKSVEGLADVVLIKPVSVEQLSQLAYRLLGTHNLDKR